jgi:type II restriction enzyme
MAAMDTLALTKLIGQYKSDPESVYNTWFVGGEERLKAFRSIRRGVRDTVDSIATGTLAMTSKDHPWRWC